MVATESCKPPFDVRKSDAAMAGQTTFMNDYIPYPLPEKTYRPAEAFKPPSTSMEGVSVYQRDYPYLKGDRPQLARRQETRSIPNVKFSAVPTYSTDYKKWALPPRESYKENREYKLPDQKMDNMSTFRRDYRGHVQPPRQSAKPPNVAFQSEVPLQSETIHRINFIPHSLEPRPPREPQRYAAPTVSMDTKTTFRESYQGTRSFPAESAKPPQTHHMSTEPIASSSEFRDRFVAWPVERPYRHEMERYKKPAGEIDLQTTSQLEFRHVRGRPAESKKPEAKRVQSKPFAGTTNYRTDFKKWNLAREQPKARDQSLHPSGKFEGQSTTRLHFVRHSAQPARSCKPNNRAFMSEAPLQGNTIYRTDYIPQSMDMVERYPTPDWLKEQYDRWNHAGAATPRRPSSGRGMTPQSTRLVQAVA